MSENVILTCATGYNETQLKPFILSAAQTDMVCEIVLLRRTTDAILNFDSWNLKNIRVSTCAYKLPELRSSIFRKAIGLVLRGTRFVPVVWRLSLWPLLHVSLNRHFMYADYLKKHPELQKVLLCDSRDVVFQSDPFAFPLPENSVLLAEEDSQLIQEPTNLYWMKRLEGTLKFNAELYRQKVICSGVILGTYVGIQDYISAMQYHMLKAMPVLRTDGGFDQPITIIVARSGVIKSLVLKPSGLAPVCHIGSHWSALYDIDEELGLLTKSDHSLVPVVHQYDRYPDLIRLFSHIMQIPGTDMPSTKV